MASPTSFVGNFSSIRRLFYLLAPSEVQFENVADVPDYIQESVPLFYVVMLVEILVDFAKNGKSASLYRVNDSLTSLGSGMLLITWKRAIATYLELEAYVWLYSRFHIFDLHWKSPLTFFIAFVGVDFFYYWFHRAAHELHALWVFHQVHHSSEDYNITTAIRKSIIQPYTSFVFYLPLALFGIPPQAYLAHLSLNLLFQVWIHTQLIGRLGVLELFLNTASHHRVHHGSNPYCIDKNYGGTLIIWDRLFGTFAAERDDEPVVYGLTENVNSFAPLYVQLFDAKRLLFEVLSDKSIDRFKEAFYPSSWLPPYPYKRKDKGTPKYDPAIPAWSKCYILVHFLFVSVVFSKFIQGARKVTDLSVLGYAAFVVVSLECFGMMFDGKAYGFKAEALRCAYVLLSLIFFPDPMSTNIQRIAGGVFFTCSGVLMLRQSRKSAMTIG